MTRRPCPYGQALTLEQYRAVEPELTRPLTADPIGHNPGRRLNDARGSRLITTHTPIRARAAEEAA